MVRETWRRLAWFMNGGFDVTQTSGIGPRVKAGFQFSEVMPGAAMAAPDQARSG